MGQKLISSLFIYSPNSDGFYIFYISQGSVATQLRCGGMFSNHFIANFQQNAPMKKFWQSVNICQRYGQNFVAYFFGPPCMSSKFLADRTIVCALLGLPGVRFLTGQSGFSAISPVKNMMLNRTISCPVFGRPWKMHEIWSFGSQQNH